MGNLTRRSFLAFGISLFLDLVLSIPILAHERPDHDKEFEEVFLDGEKFNGDRAKAREALEAAAYLCIDQFQTNGTNDLDVLKKYRVSGLPKSLREINPPDGEVQLSGTNHHYYTHRGWNFIYEKDKANWEVRKKILLNTTEKVFNFSLLPSFIVGYDKQCDSFAALVYYVHILGDYLEDDTCAKFSGGNMSRKIPFALAHPTDDAPDLLEEIKKHLATLFENQKDSSTYMTMIRRLQKIATKARKLAGSTGGINTNEKLEEAHGYVEELMSFLTGREGPHCVERRKTIPCDISNRYENYVYKLLLKEEFFTKVFG